MSNTEFNKVLEIAENMFNAIDGNHFGKIREIAYQIEDEQIPIDVKIFICHALYLNKTNIKDFLTDCVEGLNLNNQDTYKQELNNWYASKYLSVDKILGNNHCLFWALVYNQFDLFKTLVLRGADIHQKFGDTSILEFLTPRAGFDPKSAVDMVKFALEHGAIIENLDKLLFLTIGTKNKELARLFVEMGANVNANVGGFSVLHKAIDEGDNEVAKYLIDAGADKEALLLGETTLHHAISSGQVEIAKYLIDKGANKERLYNGHTSPINRTILLNQIEIAKYLIDNGANIESPQRTALHEAIYHGRVEIAKYLIDKGANIEALHNHRPPVHLAIDNINSNNTSNAEITRYLLAKGANVNARISEDIPNEYLKGATLVHRAININLQRDLFKTILSYNPDLTLRDQRGITALRAIQTTPTSFNEAYKEFINDQRKLYIPIASALKNKDKQNPLRLLPNEALVNVVAYAQPDYMSGVIKDKNASRQIGIAHDVISKSKKRKADQLTIQEGKEFIETVNRNKRSKQG